MNRYQPLLLGLGLLALAGCDSAEQAAGSFAKKVEEAAVETARESLGETIKEFDKQVDQAQEDTRQWLDQAQPKPEQDPPAQEAEQQPAQDMIET